MDIIIKWVSQIIIFLLLAAIIDLLIPATSMKKYIKLVVGLILLLIFLKPVFHIFNMNIDQAVQSSLSTVFDEKETDDSMENLIKMQKSEIQASQDAYILEQMASQLKQIAKDPLQENYQAEISDIDFSFSTEEISYEGLEEIIVMVKDSEGGEGVVNKIEEVVIDTKSPEIKDREEGMDEKEIADSLKQLWELDNKSLIVKWEGGTS